MVTDHWKHSRATSEVLRAIVRVVNVETRRALDTWPSDKPYRLCHQLADILAAAKRTRGATPREVMSLVISIAQAALVHTFTESGSEAEIRQQCEEISTAELLMVNNIVNGEFTWSAVELYAYVIGQVCNMCCIGPVQLVEPSGDS